MKTSVSEALKELAWVCDDMEVRSGEQEQIDSDMVKSWAYILWSIHSILQENNVSV